MNYLNLQILQKNGIYNNSISKSILIIIRNTINETIHAVKDNAGLLAYYIADEPDGAKFGLDPTLLKEVYDFIKSQDPYHPVTLVLNCVNSAPRYVDCAGLYPNILLYF